MPIYEYRCPKCGVFELSQRITAAPLQRCPTCKGKVSKLISSTSFTLKGSGWYATDYAGKGKSDGSTSDSKTEGKEPAGKDTSAKESSKESSKETAKDAASSKTEASAA